MNENGLYSKAAKIIRSYPSEKGTAEQMIAFAKKAGLKQSELDNASPPTGPINREALAQHFEKSLPNVRVEQYGENPSYLSETDRFRLRDLQQKDLWANHPRTPSGNPLTSEERAEHDRLKAVRYASPRVVGTEEDGEAEPMYGEYRTKGGTGYRERLLTLGPTEAQSEAQALRRKIDSGKRSMQYNAPVYGNNPDHPTMKAMAANIAKNEEKLQQMGSGEAPSYQSSHWSEHPNVIAHIRMQDRTVGEDRDAVRPIAEKLAQRFNANIRDLSSGSATTGVKEGIITPEEGASISRVMRWNNGLQDKKGLGKRLLHVEELQSDWAQEGRDQGFSDPSNPFEVFETKTGKTLSRHPTHSAAWDAFRSIPEDQAQGLDYGSANEKPHAAPYVQNTQHWTDLALKNVMREAALGNYDGVVFTPGQAQADRYGLDKKLDRLQYLPRQKRVVGFKGGQQAVVKEGIEQADLPGLIGKDMTDRLLHPDNTFEPTAGNQLHELRGDDLKMGGQGMRGYYDKIVPKSVLSLAQQHDPDAKFGEPIGMTGEGGGQYQGLYLPMTDKMRQGILNDGYPAMKRGGQVDQAMNLTRRFTKDGTGATMALKPKGN